jgi:hypothetical protein
MKILKPSFIVSITCSKIFTPFRLSDRQDDGGHTWTKIKTDSAVLEKNIHKQSEL